MLSLVFITSSFIVTEENLLFETVQSGLPSFECFHSYVSFAFLRNYWAIFNLFCMLAFMYDAGHMTKMDPMPIYGKTL